MFSNTMTNVQWNGCEANTTINTKYSELNQTDFILTFILISKILSRLLMLILTLININVKNNININAK